MPSIKLIKIYGLISFFYNLKSNKFIAAINKNNQFKNLLNIILKLI